MDVPYLSISLVIGATLLIGGVEIQRESKVSLRPTGATAMYAVILTLGSALATMLAWPVVSDKFGGRHPYVIETIAGVLGVFGAQGLVRNLSVTAFGKDLLTFDTWVQRTKDQAVATQVRAAAKADAERDAELVRLVSAHADLDTLVFKYLGDGAGAKHDALAQTNKADPKLSKGFALVEANRQAVEAFVKRKK